jgi:hypothetical protein
VAKPINITVQVRLNGTPTSKPLPVTVRDGDNVVIEQDIILDVRPAVRPGLDVYVSGEDDD